MFNAATETETDFAADVCEAISEGMKGVKEALSECMECIGKMATPAPAAPVNLPAPIVNVSTPAGPTPIVNIEAPQPSVRPKGMTAKFTRDFNGDIKEADVIFTY